MAMTTTEARDGFADICNRVAYSGERIVLHRRGKDIVAIVPLEVLHAIEALEVAAARKALKEPGRRPWSEVRGELGLEEPKAKKSRRKPSRAKAAAKKKTRRRKRAAVT